MSFLRLLLLPLVIAILSLFSQWSWRPCRAAPTENVLVRSGPNNDKTVAPIRFRNVVRTAGIDFVLENNPTPQKHAIETMPGGVAAFDYDGDGLTDIYVTNGAAIPSMEKESSRFYNRLYRNDGGMKFTDVTDQASVRGAGYSMGVAAADYDNDGHVDIFVAGVNRNILYRNTGKGRFEDVTAQAGIQSPVWSVAAGWFDYDNDGWLICLSSIMPGGRPRTTASVETSRGTSGFTATPSTSRDCPTCCTIIEATERLKMFRKRPAS